MATGGWCDVPMNQEEVREENQVIKTKTSSSHNFLWKITHSKDRVHKFKPQNSDEKKPSLKDKIKKVVLIQRAAKSFQGKTSPQFDCQSIGSAYTVSSDDPSEGQGHHRGHSDEGTPPCYRTPVSDSSELSVVGSDEIEHMKDTESLTLKPGKSKFKQAVTKLKAVTQFQQATKVKEISIQPEWEDEQDPYSCIRNVQDDQGQSKVIELAQGEDRDKGVAGGKFKKAVIQLKAVGRFKKVLDQKAGSTSSLSDKDTEHIPQAWGTNDLDPSSKSNAKNMSSEASPKLPKSGKFKRAVTKIRALKRFQSSVVTSCDEDVKKIQKYDCNTCKTKPWKSVEDITKSYPKVSKPSAKRKGALKQEDYIFLSDEDIPEFDEVSNCDINKRNERHQYAVGGQTEKVLNARDAWQFDSSSGSGSAETFVQDCRVENKSTAGSKFKKVVSKVRAIGRFKLGAKKTQIKQKSEECSPEEGNSVSLPALEREGGERSADGICNMIEIVENNGQSLSNRTDEEKSLEFRTVTDTAPEKSSLQKDNFKKKKTRKKKHLIRQQTTGDLFQLPETKTSLDTEDKEPTSQNLIVMTGSAEEEKANSKSGATAVIELEDYSSDSSVELPSTPRYRDNPVMCVMEAGLECEDLTGTLSGPSETNNPEEKLTRVNSRLAPPSLIVSQSEPSKLNKDAEKHIKNMASDRCGRKSENRESKGVTIPVAVHTTKTGASSDEKHKSTGLTQAESFKVEHNSSMQQTVKGQSRSSHMTNTLSIKRTRSKTHNHSSISMEKSSSLTRSKSRTNATYISCDLQSGSRSNVISQGQIPPKTDLDSLRASSESRLEAELEEARRKHEEELARQEAEARHKMEAEVERTRHKASLEMSMQRHEFEDRLADLEKNLTEHRKKKLESDQNCQQAEGVIRKLEQQKMMLEQEVLAGRKRLELESRASQKAVQESRVYHSKIVEQLEKEKQKIKQEVATLKQKRGDTPCLTPRMTPVTGVGGQTPSQGRADLYRVALLLREANKISQYLKKETVFSRHELTEDNDLRTTLVKVTNTRLGVTTFWTMDKFEDKLLQMREIFQGEAETSSMETDEVFYNPSDTWEKEERVGATPKLSPHMLRSLRQQVQGDERSKLSFDSVSSTSSFHTPRKFLLGSLSSVSSEEEFNRSSSVMGLCRDYITSILHTFKGVAFQESIADKMLGSCEVLRTSVINLRDSYTSFKEDRCKGSFSEQDIAQTQSFVLTAHTQVLMSSSALWQSMLAAHGSRLVRELGDKVTTKVRTLANQMVLFLQGCENDVDSIVQEAASQLQQLIQQLCGLCGQLALATDTPVCRLQGDTGARGDGHSQHDSRLSLSPTVQKHFLGGCEEYVGRTLQGGLRTVEDCHLKTVDLAEDFTPQSTVVTADMLKQIELTTASTKVLLDKLQNIQMDLDSSMQDSSVNKSRQSSGDAPTPSYAPYYSQCQALNTQVNTLTEALSHLVKATEALCKGGEESSLRRLVRCSESIEKSITTILTVSLKAPNSHTNFHNMSDSLEFSLLSDSHYTQAELAGQEVKLAMSTLSDLVRKADRGLVKSTLLSSPTRSAGSRSSASKHLNGRRNLGMMD